MKIGPTGIWLNAVASDHRFDAGLAAAIASFVRENGGNVLDIGCGTGDYVRALRQAKIECDGYDGNPNTEAMTAGLCGVLDFSQPIQLPASYAWLPLSYAWVLSLEVGEHIPREYERNFIHNLHNHNERGIILSWAVPGQGGNGHLNERSNEYIKGEFEQLGYHNNLEAENSLRAAVTDCYWFRDTLMVFERDTNNGEGRQP